MREIEAIEQRIAVLQERLRWLILIFGLDLGFLLGFLVRGAMR